MAGVRWAVLLQATNRGEGAAIVFLQEITFARTWMPASNAKGARWAQLDKEGTWGLLDSIIKESVQFPKIAMGN